MPKVSVIIPVYRVEKYLPACLESVLAQSLEDIEVICIDDASPDACPRLLDEFASRDERLHVIHLPENRQQGHGRNLGMDAAAGEYLYFLDADDMITPHALGSACRIADRDALDGLFFDSKAIYENDELARRHAYYPAARSSVYEDKVYVGRELFEAFTERGEWTCYVQRQLWRRDFIRNEHIRFPEGTEHEDEWFPFAATLLAGRVRYVPAAWFIRRYRPDSVMTRPTDPRDFHGYFRLYCMMTEFAETRGLRSGAVDVNIGRIYDKLLCLYPGFAAGKDPESLFSDPAERRSYRFFAQTQRADAFYLNLCRNVCSRLAGREDLYIYGAGQIARRVYRGLILGGYTVRGFLVSDRHGNPDTLFGRPVLKADGVSPTPGSAAVIAVSEGYRAQVESVLAAREWTYFYYQD